jgi:hypothetical protein
MFACEDEIHGHTPTTISITLDHPMGDNAHRLMDRFESRLTLAHGFNGETPNGGWSIESELHVRAEPLINQS